jgi:hypothetical protein
MSEHLIRKLPDYLDSQETQQLFNSLGLVGWELLQIKNTHAYFMKHSTPIAYKFVKNDNYLTDVETTLNTVGYDNWILILVTNGYSVLKQIQIA